MYYIGIDLGTSSVKLLLMDKSGSIINITTREYPLYLNDKGWSEQNPSDWWNGVVTGIKELIKDIDTEKVRAISFSGQMHGLVTLDDKDNVIRPAILWNDQRTQEQCSYLNGLGREVLSQHTANIALTGFTAPKILWMKKKEPELFEKISKIMLPKDYIAYRLSGVHATDVSDASGMLLLDVKNKKWSQFMLDTLELEEQQLPKVYESYDVVGTLIPEVAQELGLLPDTKIIIGGGDQAVGAVGTGTVGNNMCSISLGTSGVVFVASDEFNVDDNNALHSFCHANGKYHLMGVMLSAAASNKWWMEEILKTKDHVAEQCNITELGQNKVFFLPYLTGERTPHNDAYARGAFVGMSPNTSREDMTQAVLEGVAFALRDMLEIVRDLGVNVTSVRINGGGAKSPLWRKIVANVLNARVERINSEEGPAYGAAILASVGDGAYSSVQEATEKLIQVTDYVEAEENLVSLYNERYPIFRRLYQDIKETYKLI